MPARRPTSLTWRGYAVGHRFSVKAMATHRSYPRDIRDQLLAGISPDARQDIIAGSRRRTLRPAQVLFRTGEPAERLFVLRQGRVKFARLAHTGREIVMAIPLPGTSLASARS